MLLFAFTRLLYTFLRENFNVHFIFLVQELFSVLFFSVLVNLIFDLIFFDSMCFIKKPNVLTQF